MLFDVSEPAILTEAITTYILNKFGLRATNHTGVFLEIRENFLRFFHLFIIVDFFLVKGRFLKVFRQIINIPLELAKEE